MSEWTPEATEYLDGYLKQVRALARDGGEDDEEIVSDLREHITAKIELDAHSLVTVGLLRQTLTDVGSPEQIVGIGIPGASRGDAHVGGVSNRSTLPVPTQEGIAGRRGNASRRAAIFGVFTLAALVSFFTFLNFDAIAGLTKSDESIAREVCLKIRAAQTVFVSGGIHDADRDGVPDFGTLQQLFEAGLIPEELSTGTVRGLHISLTVTASDNKGTSYTCAVKRTAADETPLCEISDEKLLVQPVQAVLPIGK